MAERFVNLTGSNNLTRKESKHFQTFSVDVEDGAECSIVEVGGELVVVPFIGDNTGSSFSEGLEECTKDDVIWVLTASVGFYKGVKATLKIFPLDEYLLVCVTEGAIVVEDSDNNFIPLAYNYRGNIPEEFFAFPIDELVTISNRSRDWRDRLYYSTIVHKGENDYSVKPVQPSVLLDGGYWAKQDAEAAAEAERQKELAAQRRVELANEQREAAFINQSQSFLNALTGR